jgi:hypothetical protein
MKYLNTSAAGLAFPDYFYINFISCLQNQDTVKMMARKPLFWLLLLNSMLQGSEKY